MVCPIADRVPCSEIASILGCDCASLPITYLSLLLGANSSLKSIWDPVIEKLSQRLAGW